MTSRFGQVRIHIVALLERELSPRLHYHNVHHVLDVTDAAIRIAQSEALQEKDIDLIATAALYHDIGFLKEARDHETIGCDYAHQQLPSFGFNNEEIDLICGMIMATKVPQSPRNLMEEILCDADLDYLGRDDFFETGNKVFMEMKEFGQVSDDREWNELQVRFLTSHHYFTQTSKLLRKPRKEENLEKVRQLLK